MSDDKDFRAKRQYVLSLDQLKRIENLVCKNEWKGLLKKEDMGILAINLIIAEDIANKFYPAETDERLRKRLLKDFADFLGVVKDDAKKLFDSPSLTMLMARIKVLRTFLENIPTKSAA